jgi:hypothetical protein
MGSYLRVELGGRRAESRGGSILGQEGAQASMRALSLIITLGIAVAVAHRPSPLTTRSIR